MLVCKKPFQQYKEGERLPLNLPKNVIEYLINNGFAEDDGTGNLPIRKDIREFIKRNKANPKKNYKRKPRKKSE